MNSFSIRYVREGIRYRGEYRLAHWSGFKTVRNLKGEVIDFAFPMDAYMAASTEFLRQLNSVPAFTGIITNDSAKSAAEALFTRKADGETRTEEERPVDVREDGNADRLCG